MTGVACFALLLFASEPVLETQAVPGSEYEKISVFAESETPVDAQAEAIWAMSAPTAARDKMIVRHAVVEESTARRLFYEVVSAPPVAQRDYVLSVDKQRDGDAVVITYASVDDRRFPPTPGTVRMRLHAKCVISPTASGGSKIVYEMHTDVGGDLPAWLVKGPQRRSILDTVKTMVARGRRVIATR